MEKTDLKKKKVQWKSYQAMKTLDKVNKNK